MYDTLHITNCDVNKFICKQVLSVAVIVYESYPNKVYVKEVVSNDEKESSNVMVQEVVSNANFEGTYNSSDKESMRLIPLSFFDDNDVDTNDDDEEGANILEEMPPPLEGGILINGTYDVSAKTMNKILFKSGSEFQKEVLELQKTTDWIEGPWIKGELGMPKRVVTYTKAATKLVKAAKVIEDHMYTQADKKGFVVNVSASTPDVPYGKTFRTDLQYCIFSGKVAKTSYFRVSWNVFFLKNTMMKGIIESGARQGLQDNYKDFVGVLERYAKPLKPPEVVESLDRETIVKPNIDQQALGLEKLATRNKWQISFEYFCNVRVFVTLVSTLLLILNIYVSKSGVKLGIWKLELSDTLCELILSALLGAQMEYLISRARKLLCAKLYRGENYDYFKCDFF